ncbi:hypothetical protein B0G76_8331 [Paraburkholderia sp. BL23I1N1]|uniref:hypothetical protein n=1 Tax=Paraburkholderia sp. BL23I1N1 TaxID=1938802 RepID=UPI000FF5C6B5|nr:hypothetical protein [Paraburkholderia sp. BL23I1N1]RKE24444.1 hypothetical protein B0G76_8331 [Paraburkholderia sp. BL23I1N1]
MTQSLNPLPTPARTPVGTNTSSADNASAPGVAKVASSPVLFAMKVFLESEQPEKGVVLVTNSDPTDSAVAMAAVAHGIVCDDAIANQQIRHISNITFLHPSGRRALVPVKAFASSAVKAKLREVPVSHCTNLNPLVPEGVHIVLNQLKPGECIFVQIDYQTVVRDVAIAALAELNVKIKELGAVLVIFVLHSKKQDVSWLQGHCGMFVEVGKCEPGPGAQAAVALTNVSLSSWHSHGIGRVMVEAFLEPDNTWSYRSEPFIAGRAIIRLAWCLCRKGVKLEQIAKVIGIDKSNISRGLALLLIPPNNTVGLVSPKGCRKRWISRYPEAENVWPVNKPDQRAGTNATDEVTKVSTPSKTDNTGHVVNGASAIGRVHPAPPNDKS